MNINIDYQTRTPIYEQIVRSIESFVTLNLIKPSDQIPSIRDLAYNLGVNPNTVKKAYDILEQKGIIITKSTKGTFIADDISNAKEQKIKEIVQDLNLKINELKSYGLTFDEIIKKLG